MKPRHQEYIVDWRASRPGDSVQDGEPSSLIDSWPFLVCGTVIAALILIARSQRWIP